MSPPLSCRDEGAGTFQTCTSHQEPVHKQAGRQQQCGPQPPTWLVSPACPRLSPPISCYKPHLPRWVHHAPQYCEGDTHMHARAHTRIYTYAHTQHRCTHARAHICTTDTHTHTNTQHRYTHSCTHTCTHMYVHTTQTHKHTDTHITQMHTHTHTYTYTHITHTRRRGYLVWPAFHCLLCRSPWSPLRRVAQTPWSAWDTAPCGHSP